LYFSSRVISGVLAYVGLFFISRYLGPDIYGTIAWAMAFVATFNSISDLGFNSAHIKRISEGQDPSECLSTFIAVKLLLTGALVVFLLIVIAIWQSVMGEGLPSDQIQVVTLFIVYQVFYDISMIATMTFDARLETAKTQISMLMDPIVRIPLVVIVSVYGMSALDLAYAYVIGATSLAVISLLMLSRDRYRFTRPTMFRSYLVFAIPLSIVVIITTLSVNIDKILLGVFWTDADVGYYTTCQTILNIFGMLGVAVSTLTFPAFSKMHSDGDTEGVRRNTIAAERYIIMLILPVVTVLVLFPTEISLVLLGDQFRASGGPMRFLAISLLLNVLNLMYMSHVNAANRPDLTAKMVFLSLVVNIVFLLTLVPGSLGDAEMLGLAATGAAIANMISFIVLAFSNRTVVYKLTGTPPNKRLVIHLLGSIITGAAILALSLLIPLDGWLTLILYGLVAVAVFYLSLFIMRELRREDIDYFLGILRPDKMKEYVVSELKRKNE
jgi:O-antigen/teichoic acid export membrane protein